MHFQHHCSYLLWYGCPTWHDPWRARYFSLRVVFFCLLSFVLRCVMPVAGPLIPAQTSTFYVPGICFPIYSWSRFALVFSSSVLYVRTTFFHVCLPTRYVLTLNVIFFLPRRIWPCLSYSARRRIGIEKEVRDIRGMGGAQRNTDRGNNDFSGNRGCPRNAGSRRQTGWHFWLY